MNFTFMRWIKNYFSILKDIATGMGTSWVSIELLSYATSESIDTYTKNTTFFLIILILVIIISLFKNKPKTSFTCKLRDKDNYIEIKVGDAFENIGALVVPINDCFDVSLGGNVKKAKSLQNKLIKEFYNTKEEHLEKDISEKIDISKSYEIGTTVEIEQKNKIFYLLVNSRKKDNNRVESSVDDFLLSLSKLWEYISSESGRNESVTIPLINTNHGRLPNMNRMTALKEIIYSYIESSKYYDISDKLIISIHPHDLKKGNIDLDEIEEYLKFSCKHFRIVKLSEKVEGEGISASTVETINN